jgi:hypothetical protein
VGSRTATNSTGESAMEPSKQDIAERLRHWKRLLAIALQDTSASEERRRLEQELLWLEQTRSDLDRLPEEKLEALGRRLAADPQAWLLHH